jgi:DNA-binding transcriptional LysR family regulator
MHQVNLRHVDLNLLTVLDALLAQRSVTRAAMELGMSQPAVSRALARLRTVFKDPLLVDGVGGYILSARASDLVPSLRQTLAEIGDMLATPTFDPSSARGTIRLSTPDLYASVIIPPLLERIGREAPGLDVEVVPPDRTILDRLQDGGVEAVLGVISEAPAGIVRRSLFEDRYVTLMRVGHPASKQTLTMKRFLALEHIAVSITGTGSMPVDSVLGAQGLKRRVRVSVPSFLGAVEIAARSDLVMTLPESLARNAAGMDRFVVNTPPANPGRFTLSMFWHRRHQEAPRHVWLRNAIVVAAEAVETRLV